MRGALDAIIIGAGLYGLYAADLLSKRGKKCMVLEMDQSAMRRATWINQARVHNGYHYPRSLSTAGKSAHYYRRFHDDFGFCIKRDFQQIYATSSLFSWTNREQFIGFCRAAGIPCRELPKGDYFKDDSVDGAFLTEEDTYDAGILREHYLSALRGRAEIIYGARLLDIRAKNGEITLHYKEGGITHTASAGLLVNATYASANQVLELVNKGLSEAGMETLPLFKIKYELCEIILCEPNDALSGIGITVMDGPFFSIMPFGKTGLHSLTAVTHTPHMACMSDLPVFGCQEGVDCSAALLNNCNDCRNKPATAWPYMRHLADKYLKPEFDYRYHSSLFSMKPILRSTEIDDARPTTIRTDEIGGARLVSALSGKINTVYDLDEVL